MRWLLARIVFAGCIGAAFAAIGSPARYRDVPDAVASGLRGGHCADKYIADCKKKGPGVGWCEGQTNEPDVSGSELHEGSGPNAVKQQDNSPAFCGGANGVVCTKVFDKCGDQCY